MNRWLVLPFALFAAAIFAVPGVASARRAAALSAQDVNYLQTSISGDRFEIIGGRMALRKASTSSVRALGARLLKDHSKSLKDSLAQAKRFGVDVPKAPTPSMVWELQTVGSMNGTQFDRAYSHLELKDHQQDIEETTFEVVHGGNAEVRQSAKNELPMLRMHLALSKRAYATGV